MCVLFFLCFCVSSVISYTDSLGSCASNRKKCSQFADCRDYSSGYCCHCRPGFYGNGIQCVAEGDCTYFFFLFLESLKQIKSVLKDASRNNFLKCVLTFPKFVS